MLDDLRARYLERQPLLEELRQNLDMELQAVLRGVPHIDRIVVRVKDIDSFLKKALDSGRPEPYTDPLSEIEDQVAGRVIVFFLDDIQIVHDRLLTNFHRVEQVRKEPKRDAEFGYQSEHLVLTIPPQVKPEGWQARDDLPATVEFQLRTIFMHAWAEPEHELRYKGARDLPREIRRELAWVAASAWGADHGFQRVCAWHRAAAEAEQPEGASTLRDSPAS